MEMQSHWTPHAEEPKSFFEKGWFMGLMIVLVVGLGVAIWWITTHPRVVEKWMNPRSSQSQVEKPSVPQKTTTTTTTTQ